MNSCTNSNPSCSSIARLHSFASASNTGSHSAGGGSSSLGTLWDARFMNVTRTAAAVLVLSRVFSHDQKDHVDTVLGSGVYTFTSRQRIRMDLFRKLLLRRNDGERRRRYA